MRYLNLGCGYKYASDKEWTNIDIISTGPKVIAHDLKKGIPFPDGSFDLVYHSHVLEHIPKSKADFFIKECIRVLKPNGILRVVIPDLEQITRNYLRLLEEGVKDPGSKKIASDYDWIMLEMYDQAVRNKKGGEMMAYIADENFSNPDFVIERCGTEVQKIIEGFNNKKRSLPAAQAESKDNLLKKVSGYLFNSELRRRMLLRIFFKEEHTLLHKDEGPYQIGKYRSEGEIHQWMYDRYSINRIFISNNLRSGKQQKAYESYVENWGSYHLDNLDDDSAYKPDSLYMEAIK